MIQSNVKNHMRVTSLQVVPKILHVGVSMSAIWRMRSQRSMSRLLLPLLAPYRKCTRKHTHTTIRTNAHTHTHIHICTHANTSTHPYLRARICRHALSHTNIYTNACAKTDYTRTYAQSTCAHTHTHMCRWTCQRKGRRVDRVATAS
jgi:hypothetical protein